jgi:hypothetical protein
MQLKAQIFAVLTLGTGGMAHAQMLGPDLGRGQKFVFNVGGFWADINTVARAGGRGGQIGTRLDLERDLGLDDNDFRFIGGLSYRFNRRHAIDVSYFDLKRSADRTVSADFEFAEQLFARQTTVHTSFDTRIWRLSYSFAFVDSERHRATAQVGFHYAQLDTNINRTAGTQEGEASADAPLPVVGFSYAYRFSPRWMAEVSGQIFRLEVDDVDGRIDNFSAVVGVGVLENVSIFGGYTYYLMDVDISKRLWTGETKLDYQGPWVGFVVGFGKS